MIGFNESFSDKASSFLRGLLPKEKKNEGNEGEVNATDKSSLIKIPRVGEALTREIEKARASQKKKEEKKVLGQEL